METNILVTTETKFIIWVYKCLVENLTLLVWQPITQVTMVTDYTSCYGNLVSKQNCRGIPSTHRPQTCSHRRGLREGWERQFCRPQRGCRDPPFYHSSAPEEKSQIFRVLCRHMWHLATRPGRRGRCSVAREREREQNYYYFLTQKFFNPKNPNIYEIRHFSKLL